MSNQCKESGPTLNFHLRDCAHSLIRPPAFEASIRQFAIGSKIEPKQNSSKVTCSPSSQAILVLGYKEIFFILNCGKSSTSGSNYTLALITLVSPSLTLHFRFLGQIFNKSVSQALSTQRQSSKPKSSYSLSGSPQGRKTFSLQFMQSCWGRRSFVCRFGFRLKGKSVCSSGGRSMIEGGGAAMNAPCLTRPDTPRSCT